MASSVCRSPSAHRPATLPTTAQAPVASTPAAAKRSQRRAPRPPATSLPADHPGPRPPASRRPTRAQRLKHAARDSDDWRLGLSDLEHEHIDPVALTSSWGRVPADLAGTLVRMGPARFDIFGERVNSWWDGEGMMHALHFDRGQVTYRNRFVDTAERREEGRLRRREYATLAGRPRHGILGLMKNHMRSKNLANTSVAQVGHKLLALYESDIPHAIDPITLQTLGLETFGGAIKKSFGAHPKTHPTTGSIWNFGFELGMPGAIRLYECTPDGQLHDRFSFAPPYLTPFIHDFILTEHKATFVFSPVVISRFPWRMMLGLSSPWESCRWDPQQGSVAMVFDLSSQKLSRWDLPAQLVVHTVDGREEADGRLEVDMFAQDHADGLQVALDMVKLKTPAHHWPMLRRLTLHPDGSHQQQDLGVQMDFPALSPLAGPSRRHRRLYGLGWHPDKELYGEPMSFDRDSGRTLTAPLGPQEYSSELVPVGRAAARRHRDVYLMSFVLDGPNRRTDLRIYDGADLRELCRLALPHAVPHTFHGVWLSQR